MPIPNKDGKFRMCVDYRYLNKAYLNDDFPLPHIDLLVENIAKMHYSYLWIDFWSIVRLRWL